MDVGREFQACAEESTRENWLADGGGNGYAPVTGPICSDDSDEWW